MGRKARGKRDEPIAKARPQAAAAVTSRPATSRASTSANAWVATALWIAGLWIAAAAAYAGSIGTPFLLDDPINITKNPQIQLPLSIASLIADPRALVTASLRLNYLAGGFSVAGYHVLNIVAHAIAGTLVFLLARATLRLPVFRRTDEPAAHGNERVTDALAAVIALIFLMHPMQTESVTYVIQRAEIFVSAALTASLLAFSNMDGGTSARTLVALAVSCIAGIYSKPSFAVVPALLLVYDLCFLVRAPLVEERRTGQSEARPAGRFGEIARRWPAYAIAAVAALWTFVLTKTRGGFEAETAGFDVAGITPIDYLGAQAGVIVQYLRVALWPSRLCFDCGYRGAWPVHATFLGNSVAIPAVILLAIAAGALALWRRQPLATFAVFGSAVVLTPTSSLLPLADFYVEHRMYLPIAFLAMAVVPAANAALQRFAPHANAAGRIGAALALVVVATLAIATTRRNALLSDPVAMMEDSLAQAPNNERVQYNLANAYKRMGRAADAIPHYEAAIRIAPNVVRSYENLGSLYAEMGRSEDALRVYLAGAAAKPDAGMAHRNVASAYLRLNRPQEAFEAAKKSLEVERGNANGFRLLGAALEKLGRSGEAAEAYREGLAANPGNAALTESLANVGQR
ncbi:MAG TPA: tetratricopeptide repeat protein [Candidatus Limnocylindrales bacterium]|nr:tetratricopeptide repeat protein [Candidatus Limnocylindrales bacterium]